MARYLAGSYPSCATARAISPEGPGIDAGGEDPREAPDDLGALLVSIAEEVHRHAGAAREGVMADFAARVAHARKHLSPHVLAAALGAIREQRKAALALINRNAALELAGRQKAAVAAFGGNGPRRRKDRRTPSGGAPQEQAPRP